MKVKWRIYYDDGSTCDSLKSTPEKAPSFGVICIVQYRQDGLRFVAQGKDWYLWHRPTEQWWPADLSGILDQLLNKPEEVTALKMGRSIPDEKYSEIIKLATEDKDFLNE